MVKKFLKDGLLQQALILVGVLAIIIMLCILVLSKFTNEYNIQCCEQNNATYVFYECQCTALVPCSDDLKCGSYCEFEDGNIIPVEQLNCVFNST